MRGRAIFYSVDELAWVEQHRALVLGELHRRFVARFGRADVSQSNLAALRKRNGWATGRTGRFEKGQVSWNKGRACPEGQGGRHPNAVRTQFRKGGRTGRANQVYKPIGTERVSEEGYLERKVHDGLPLQSRWQLVHRLRWQEMHGPVPADHALKCLGDKLDTDPSNWVLVPRALLPRLNGRFGRNFDAAPAELKPLILAIARLEHGARQARKRRSA